VALLDGQQPRTTGAIENNQTHKISHFAMLLEFTSRKVKQLLSSRGRCLCQSLGLGRGSSERPKNLNRAHTVDSAHNVSPQRQNPASLQELRQHRQKKACPDL